MTQALISPIENVHYISSWNAPIAPSKIYTPVFTECGVRIAQIEPDGSTFEVAGPLFWTECDSSITPHEYCYVMSSKTFIKIPDSVPNPTKQPETTGTQTL